MLDNHRSIPDKQAVFARLGKILMVAALICAIGGHWVVLQSVAWANMLAENAGTGPLGEAIVKTFNGKHPCPLCKCIAQSRQSEKKADWQTSLKKFEFPSQSTVFFISAPVQFYLQGETVATAPLLAETPPVPPPRSLAG
jgi:hypothetical protein